MQLLAKAAQAALDGALTDHIKKIYEVAYTSTVARDDRAIERFEAGLASLKSFHAQAVKAVEDAFGADEP